jgi:hypothetical protein
MISPGIAAINLKFEISNLKFRSPNAKTTTPHATQNHCAPYRNDQKTRRLRHGRCSRSRREQKIRLPRDEIRPIDIAITIIVPH